MQWHYRRIEETIAGLELDITRITEDENELLLKYFVAGRLLNFIGLGGI